MSSDASASTDSNTYYEDDFSSTEEDSSQGNRVCSKQLKSGFYAVFQTYWKPGYRAVAFLVWNGI